MKQSNNINRAICWLLAMALAMLPTLAQESVVYSPSGIENPNVKISTSYLGKDLSQNNKKAQKAAKADGDMCTVTLNLEYDPEVFQAPRSAYLLDSNDLQGNWWTASGGSSFLQGQVPPGIYDVVASFMDYSSYAIYYVIIEQCEITGNVTFTLSPEQCSNHISTKCYGADGELLKHGLGYWDENDLFVVEQEGNVDWTAVDNMLYLKGAGILETKKLIYNGPVLNEEARTAPHDIYVNNTSNRYLFIQHRTDMTEDISKTYINYFSTNEVEAEKILENVPHNYVQQLYAYKYSPIGSQQFGYAFTDVFGLISKVDNFYGFNSTGVTINNDKPDNIFTHEVWANIPYTDPHFPELDILVQEQFADNGEVEVSEYEGEEWIDYIATGWTIGQTLRVKNGEKESTNIGHHYRGLRGMQFNSLYDANINDIVLLPQFLPSPEPFTYPAEQILGIPGDNCPINAMKVESYENDGQVYLQIQDYYVGRYGETLCSNIGVNTSLKYNGEDVDLEAFAPEDKGTYELTSINTNIEVDGLSGHNTASVFLDQNQEDMTPPSIEMLHFKNGDGGVTDHFDTAADGTMEFYASDFHYHYIPQLWGGVFECQPVEVEIGYAPYGTENWNELDVEEIPEFYQEPGWGYFYRGTLAGVTGQALKGWFDLKVKLTDAAGNWQEQVISPAFRIDDLAYTSVATVGSDNAHEVARYSIDGKRVDATHRGVTIIRMSDGTTKKIVQ